MSKVTAQLSNYRQSPRKVRLVADIVRGKTVTEALNELTFTTKRATEPLLKLMRSAVANARTMSIDSADLFVSEIRVDQGAILKRMMPRARGRGARINKRTSHIILTLDTEKPVWMVAREVKRADKKNKSIEKVDASAKLPKPAKPAKVAKSVKTDTK